MRLRRAAAAVTAAVDVAVCDLARAFEFLACLRAKQMLFGVELQLVDNRWLAECLTNAGKWAKWGQVCRFVHPVCSPKWNRPAVPARSDGATGRQAKRTSVKTLGNFLSRKQFAPFDTYLSPRQQIACCSVTTRPVNSCSAPFSIYNIDCNMDFDYKFNCELQREKKPWNTWPNIADCTANAKHKKQQQ